MDEKSFTMPAVTHDERTDDATVAATQDNSNWIKNKAGPCVETDEFLAAVDTALQVCAKLKTRSQQGVKQFLNRNLMYIRGDEPSKRKRDGGLRKLLAPCTKTLSTAGSSRFPLLITDSTEFKVKSVKQEPDAQGDDKRVKLQLVGFFDSEFQLFWTTTSAEMRVHLLLDVRNVRKNTMFRHSLQLFDCCTLNVNENEKDLAKRTLDSRSVDFEAIFDSVKRTFGPVRVERVRLHFQVLVTEVRKARREFLAASRESEQNVVAELGFVAPDCIASTSRGTQRQYPAKYEATHVLWERRRASTSANTAESDDSNHRFSLASRFGEYELHLHVARVGNRSSDCVFTEPDDSSLDQSNTSDSADENLPTAFENISNVLHRLFDLAGETHESSSLNDSGAGVSAEKGAQSKAKKLNVTQTESGQKKLTRRSAAHAPSNGCEGKKRAEEDDCVRNGNGNADRASEEYQYAVFRFRIVPSDLNDCTVDDCNRQYAPPRPKEPSPRKTRPASPPRCRGNGQDLSDAVNGGRRKRAAALDATNLMRLRDETFEENFRLTPCNRVKRGRVSENGCRKRKANAVANGNGLDADSPTASGSEAEGKDSEEDCQTLSAKSRRIKVSANGTRSSEAVITICEIEPPADAEMDSETSSDDSENTVRFVFAGADGASAWRIVAVRNTQCLFCALRTRSLQALVAHLTFVHLQFHFEADLELRCIGVLPRTTETATENREGYLPLVHLPNAVSVANLKLQCGLVKLACSKAVDSNLLTRKTLLSIAEPLGFLFTHCYANRTLDGAYFAQKRAELTYVLVRHCNRRARFSLILQTLSSKTALRSTARDAHKSACYSRPGLNRVFFHTCSYVPVLPDEIDDDSETENDPRWLHTRIATQLDDVIDVNDGEKQVMTLWCSHLLKHTNEFNGDCKVSRALLAFVDENAWALRARRCNFILFLSSLCDYGVINVADVRAAVRRLEQRCSEAPCAD